MAVSNASIIAHVTSMLAAAQADMEAKIAAYPERYTRDELGHKLVGDLLIAVRESASGETWADLDADAAGS